MSNWKDNLRGLGSSAAKAIAGGAKTDVGVVQEQVKESSRKRQIVDKMYPGTIKELARQRGLRPETFLNETLTIDDYKDSIVSNMSLEELIKFADKKRIDIRDVTDKIDEETSRKEQKKLEEDTSLSDEFKKVTQCIREFKPLKNYRGEYMFQAELAQYLRRDFPNTKIEVQRGSSRPDIDVNGIAIEVKGPTFDEDLITIPDKLMRYSQRFPKGIIVVLFNLHVNPHRYEEWVKNIQKISINLGRLEVIRK